MYSWIHMYIWKPTLAPPKLFQEIRGSMILDLLNVVPLVTEPNRHVTFSERGRPADTPDKELCRLPQAAQGIECDLLAMKQRLQSLCFGFMAQK